MQRLISLVSLGSLVALVNAYDIDASCDIAYVKAAADDAYLTLKAGKDATQVVPVGDFKEDLWHNPTPAQMGEVQVALNKVYNFRGLSAYQKGSSPLIYCGAKPFVKKTDASGKVLWEDAARGITLSTKATDLDKSNSPTAATTFRKSNGKLITNHDIDAVIMLYQAAPGKKGPSGDSDGNVATLDEILNQKAAPRPIDENGNISKDREGFYVGKSIDRIVHLWATSHVLLHEYMHVAQPTAVTNGKAEVYGFQPMAAKTPPTYTGAVVKTFAQALVNAETFASWCLCVVIESRTKFKVFDGFVVDRTPPGSPVTPPPGSPGSDKCKRGMTGPGCNLPINGAKPRPVNGAGFNRGPVRQTPVQPSRQPLRQPLRQPTRQTPGQSLNRVTNGRINRRPISQPLGQPLRQPVRQAPAQAPRVANGRVIPGQFRA